MSGRLALSQRGSRSPNFDNVTYRLPPEVLAHAFLFLTVFDPPGSSGRRLGWITSTTHVCSHWRKVALDTPRLWNTPSFAFRTETWTKEMLSRAKRSSLSLRIHIPAFTGSSSVSDTWKLALAKDILATRASDLHLIIIYGSSDAFAHLLSSMLQPAPLLRDLVLSSEERWITNSQIALIQMPVNLFTGSAPKLQYLRLQSTYLPWESALFSHLRRLEVVWLSPPSATFIDTFLPPYPPPSLLLSSLHLDTGGETGFESDSDDDYGDTYLSAHGSGDAVLDIDGTIHNQHLPTVEPDEQYPTPSLDRMVSILNAMPNVEMLELAYCLPRVLSSSQDSPCEALSLPELKQIYLAGEAEECAQFIDAIITPSLQCLNIRCHSQHPLKFNRLIPALLRHLRQPHQSFHTHPISHIALQTTGQGYGLRIMLNLEGVDYTVVAARFQLSSVGRWNRLSLLQCLFSQLPVDTAKMFNVEGSVADSYSAITLSEWIGCLPHLKSIQAIRMNPSTAEQLLFALHPLLTGTIFLPALLVVIVPRPEKWLARRSSSTTLLRSFLKRLLRDRRDAGFPFRFVDIKGEDLYDHIVAKTNPV